MKPRNKLTAQERHIWSLRMIIVVLVIITVSAIVAGRTSVSDITLHLPPDLSRGYRGQADTVPPAAVYSFAAHLFRAINEWEDGTEDFAGAIDGVSCLISPQFKRQLRALQAEKQRNNELARERHIATLGHYRDDLVQQSTAASWVVWLDVHIEEFVDGHPVKDSAIRYPLSVRRDQRRCNPWGLMLGGYAFRPQRLGDTP